MEQLFALKFVVDFIGKTSRAFDNNFVADPCFAQSLRFGGDYLLEHAKTLGNVGNFPIDSNLFDIMIRICDELFDEITPNRTLTLRSG